MSPRASLFRGLVLPFAVLSSTPLVAQTIADYSRAQRAVLESAIAQSTARAAGLAASAPAVSAPPAVTATAPPALMPSPTSAARGLQDPSATGPRVSGVFASAAMVVAEVDVNGTPYLLGAGQSVPGTSWRVESVAVERVVLSRRDTAGGSAASEASRRVFALPPLH